MNSAKKLILIFIFIFIVPAMFRGQALVLPYTTWATFTYQGNSPGAFFRFDLDSLYDSGNNIFYTSVSRYAEIGNVVRVFDDVSSCGTDTGKYSFTISNDTLRFTFISDLCTSRAQYLNSYYFVSLNTGIETQNSFVGLEVFPNPSSTGIFNLSMEKPVNNETKITVCTIEGKIIIEKELLMGDKNYSVDLQQFPEGIYFLTVSDETGKKVIKLLR
jgi:hypothetical protein